MKFFLALFATLLFTTHARADILFLDLNFGPKEIVAAGQVARTRGEKLYLYPERTAAQQNEIEKLYLESQRLGQKYAACRKNNTAERCEPIFKDYLAKMAEVQGLADKLKKIDPTELERIFNFAKENQIEFNSIVFSGHSGGTGLFTGLFGTLTAEDVLAVSKKVPGVIERVQSIFLWGCYSGTLHSLNDIWRKNFPNVKLIAGYMNQGPLGIRDSSGILLKGIFNNEEKLLRASNMGEAHRIFKSVPLAADLDATAVVGDYYLTYDQANSVDEMMRRCKSFDPGLLEKFDCYEYGEAGCENPPPSHQGPLRTLYSFLQVNRHCAYQLREKYPNLPTPEYVVRLIFLENIKGNFKKIHGSEDSFFRELMNESGVKMQFGLSDFYRSTRYEDVKIHSSFEKEEDALGFRDLSILENLNWPGLFRAGYAHTSLKSILGPSWIRTATNYHCVPFSWVEPGATDKDTCDLTESLAKPANPKILQYMENAYFRFRHYRFLRENAAELTSVDDKVEGKKNSYLGSLNQRVKTLSSFTNRSAIEDRWLENTKQKIAQIEPLTDKQVIEQLILNYEYEIPYLVAEFELAKARPNSEMSAQYLKFEKDDREKTLAILRKLIGE